MTDARLNLIGVHLKSKINRKQINRDAEGNLIGDYVDVALKARIKLATEANDVRAYINAKFDQLPAPGLLVPPQRRRAARAESRYSCRAL